VGVLWLLGAPTRAQPASETDAATADAFGRARFEDGVAAAGRGDWELASQAFEEAYEAVPRPRVLFNLASARIQTGRLVQGAADLRRFLSAAGANDERFVSEAELVLHELMQRIPTLELRIRGDATDSSLTVDGEARSPTAAPVPLDPGAHQIVLSRGDQVLQSERVTLAEGERRTLVLAAPMPGPALGTPTVGPHAVEVPELSLVSATPESALQEPESTDAWSLILGGALGTLGATVVAILVGLVVAQPWAPAPSVGNVSPGRVGLP